ncbi:hypothetical protein P7C70_g7485, partial [Phenoliferia sp. Uapishka_3]
MSFNFEWPTFSEDYYASAREILEQALNKGTKPAIIADRIEVKELNMGTMPPELEILEIGDLSTDRFRGIFRLTYAGDAFIVLQTKVQANPLNVPRPSLDILGSPRIFFAAAPLVVPMTLRLSSLSLRAIVVLVVSRQKGITLVFKNDPLESVNVSSSFDGVDSVAGYIQRQIEHQLREAFRSDLPGVIHRLSQKWLSGEVKSATEGNGAGPEGKGKSGKGGFAKDAKIETRTAYAPGRDGKAAGRGLTTKMGSMSVAGESVSMASDADTSYSFRTTPRSSRRPSGTNPTPSYDGLDSVPEAIESYDPTYGLRPDSIPLHAGFADYQRLVHQAEEGRGLGDILGESEEDDSFDDFDERRGPDDSYDHVGLIDLVDDGSGAQVPHWQHSPEFDDDRRSQFGFRGDSSAYETIPAVGGGTITRPRVFHIQSQMRTRTASSGSLSAHGSPSTTTARPGPASSMSTLGGFARPFNLTPLDGRQDYFAGLSAQNGTSSPRFPFPQYGGGTSFASAPSIVRSSSLMGGSPFQRRSGANQSSRNIASSSSTSPDNTRRSSSLFPSTLASSFSSAPSSKSPSESDSPPYPPTRPDPIDLLSRSPSSVLNNSFDDDLPITLNPSRNDTCAHLATLTSSNQTLSPFTRAHAHFTARSSPHVINRLGPGVGRGSLPVAARSGSSGPGGDGPPVRANRKRIHRLASAAVPSPPSSLPQTPSARISKGFAPLSSVGTGMRSTAPSEMSDYFPTLPKAGFRRGGFEDLRREVLDADRY